jgi:tetratricopeptide (TPR) repeat protein
MFFLYRAHSAYRATWPIVIRSASAMSFSQSLRHIGVIAAAALLVTAVSLKPVAVYAMGTDKGSAIEQQEQQEQQLAQEKAQEKAHETFLRGYRAAREMILAGDYRAGIAAMHALGHDEHPDVANYIGYANRKLGDYDQSKVWYEAALKADPNHVRTWSYFGMWQMEQGNRLKAEDYLAKVNAICGNTSCQEFIELRAVIDGKASY